VKANITSLSGNITWFSLAGAAFLGGIGFTMSIFITNLAFENHLLINNSKIAILGASVFAALIGVLLLRSNKTLDK
jgi:NhaA family Na+:H+ antiporter